MKFSKRSDATWLLPPLNLLLLKVLLPSLMFGMLPSPWPMLEEFSALQNQGMSCGPGFLHPLNRNVVCCRRDYKIKHPPEGSIARISPSSLLLDIISNKALWKLAVINTATVCIVLSLDVINGFLKEEMYKPQPRSFVGAAFLDHVCRLHKSNYGLKQAPQAWFHCFASHLKTLGFQVFNHLMLIPQCS